MALRVARGLFRLWLVLSVLWVGGVGIHAWLKFPDWIVVSVSQQPGKAIYEMRAPDGHTYKIEGPEGATEEQARAEMIHQNPHLGDLPEKRRSAIWHAGVMALAPPAFVLALGSALIWAFRGFR
jgi:hypothetical protein